MKPMISGETNASGRDVWYDQETLCWTVTPPEPVWWQDELQQLTEERLARESQESQG